MMAWPYPTWGNIPAQTMSVVTEDHKYIYWFFGGEGMKPAEELYHRKNDPYEMKNLAANPEHKATLEQRTIEGSAKYVRAELAKDASASVTPLIQC